VNIKNLLKINVITQLLCFFAIALLINFLSIIQIALLGVVIVICFLLLKSQDFFRLFFRLKWIYLSMLLIFAFNTPGEHVLAWPFEFSPTYEGLQTGILQVFRIVIMLAIVSLLLANNSKQMIISGFYYFLYPLKVFGLNIERFAARLWLTMHYVEHVLESKKNQSNKLTLDQQFMDIYDVVLNKNIMENEIVITIEKPHFRLVDFIILFLLVLLLYAKLFRGP
jgi:energy-coupling factor transport system permease protein